MTENEKATAPEPGYHTAVIKSIDMVIVGGRDDDQGGKTPEVENVQIELAFPECGGYRMSWWGGFGDKQWEWSAEVLEACGWKPEEHNWDLFGAFGEKDVMPDGLLGRAVRAQVYEDEFGGKVRLKIKSIYPMAEKRRSSADRVAGLAEKLRGMKRRTSEERFAGKEMQNALGQPVSDEDTPF